MDIPFLPAVAAIRSGNAAELRAILAADPGLALRRSSCSHPTLMQCLVLDGVEHDAAVQLSMARSLIERGALLDEPLIAAACVGNNVLASFLLDQGAAIDGDPDLQGGWTPLEESIYWGYFETTRLLLERGAGVPNLRAAAGLGRVDLMASFFDEAGTVLDTCGGVNSPFGSTEDVEGVECSRSQALVDNALVYAAMCGECDAATFLLERGARVNSFPFGFDYRGTALHWAAMRGRSEMCELLLAGGADPSAVDLSIGSTPAGWARYDGHEELALKLEEACAGFRSSR